MDPHYERPGAPRFTVESLGLDERIRIKARKNIPAMLFMPFWLAAWTAGGIAAITQLFANFHPFIVFWLCCWAIGWVAVSGMLAWMLFGAEIIEVTRGDLRISQVIGPLARRKLYRGSDISALKAASQSGFMRHFRIRTPFSGEGAIQFNYGARTIYAAGGLDEAEGQMIVERLGRKLPRAIAAR